MAEQEQNKEIRLPLRIRIPDDLVDHFVNHVVVQHQPDYFTLSFFSVRNPAIVGNSKEETERLIKEIKEVDAKCVARLNLTPKMMKAMVDAVNSNYKKFEAKTQRKNGE